MIQDGERVNLGDPLSSSAKRYIETSQKRQGSMEDLMEVGLTDSTLRSGEPATWGSGQRKCNVLSGRKGTM